MGSPSRLVTGLRLLACVAGIYGAYLTQGVVQETLSTKKFGPEGVRFAHLSSLNAVQCWVCFAWAALLVALFDKREPGAEYPPFTAYWKPAVTNCVGPACGLQALKYISYPAQVLAKSSKMIPVMLMGTLLHGNRYSALEYVCCLAISAGVGLFGMKSSSKVTGKLASPNAPLGYAMCLVNLVLDGYTNAAQDEIHKRYKQGSALQMMCWMNFWCGLYYVPLLFVFSSVGQDLLAFCLAHPEAGYDILLFCACGAVGQLFIFATIKTFGSLLNTLVTTTRKFFNILLSVVWNANPLLPQQWAAVALLFCVSSASTMGCSSSSLANAADTATHAVGFGAKGDLRSRCYVMNQEATVLATKLTSTGKDLKGLAKAAELAIESCRQVLLSKAPGIYETEEQAAEALVQGPSTIKSEGFSGEAMTQAKGEFVTNINPKNIDAWLARYHDVNTQQKNLNKAFDTMVSLRTKVTDALAKVDTMRAKQGTDSDTKVQAAQAKATQLQQQLTAATEKYQADEAAQYERLVQLNTDAGKLNVVVEGALEKAGQALLKMRDAIADTPIAQKTAVAHPDAAAPAAAAAAAAAQAAAGKPGSKEACARACRAAGPDCAWYNYYTLGSDVRNGGNPAEDGLNGTQCRHFSSGCTVTPLVGKIEDGTGPQRMAGFPILYEVMSGPNFEALTGQGVSGNDLGCPETA
ncbi:UDP-galactose UDP-glucose transporter 3 isoform A [Micractinium conductrix]|uniref:UDP-galactose UDP-glucose transporter 3 isoform A n=1 Tax=Micractinium conductrix TaxID=554055 RepID=A0A2P6VF59_9CHLO|nr:UDP-galactose UDP-glucose transporter 3 isoform A [Micractinium conductrix]|eukprot:PSC72711.1 UDP-galactose UDP-glucose transporter 3 isoform A [Micractinium conductrix]